MPVIQNMYCSTKALKNEASVEVHFVTPFIKDVGYTPEDISCKESISEIPVGKGRQKILYKPDFVLKIKGIPSVVIDAKSPKEDITKWCLQCSSYCLELNKYYDYNPVQYYILTNGFNFALYKWDKREPILTLEFQDFNPSNSKLEALIQIIKKSSIFEKADELKNEIDEKYFTLKKISLESMGNIFQKLHNHIWRIEKKSPSSAFTELMKIVFVKINKDKQLHEKFGANPNPKYGDVVFSAHWISSQTENENPINDPLFRNLVRSLESDIAAGKKKRIFNADEQINLGSDTIKKVVKELEHFNFYAMDEDVHGRLFESFLDATVRGKDIGQFFTPRDIVETMVNLADLHVSKDHIDSVLDACCGSGGFLITSMRNMLEKANNLSSVSNQELKTIEKSIRENSIYGIDAGSDPAMYRITRMNMYLHGAGGSKIYYADSLDKRFGKVGRGSVEDETQLNELRTKLVENSKKFDVILSNPPFSLEYSRDDFEQAEILNQYDLAVDRENGKIHKSLLSSVMFLERYKDLITDNGRILAIVDDSILTGTSYVYIRNYIRKQFIIQGIVSLPGDAFKRASARVKTSLLILRKRKENETQKDLFMASARYLGLEKKVSKRIGIDPNKLSSLKSKECASIINDYKKYLAGKPGKYMIPYENIQDRLDVKYCINDRGRKKQAWKKNGYSAVVLGNVLIQQLGRNSQIQEDIIYQLLKVTYGGDVIEGDSLTIENSSYSTLYKVKTWDILISNMGLGRGAIGIVPPFHDGKYVSNEYTIITANSKEEAVFYTHLLRTKEILADILSFTTGMNRGRITWETVSSVAVPECDKGDIELNKLVRELETYWRASIKFMKNKVQHTNALVTKYDVDGKDAHERWLGFKPPE